MALDKPTAVDSPYTTTTTNTTPVSTSTTVDTGTTTATTVVPARLSTTVDTGTTATQPIVAARINTVVDTPSSSGTATTTGVAINDGNATTAAAVTASGNPGAISYYAEGTSGVNQLAESGRYFRGANVYITLEEQKFITNNIAAQGNAEPGGETSEIQFNDAGTFGGDSGFTFNKNTNALTVAGNISGDYFIGNGSQLTGITAASSYGNANVVANLAALGTNPISTTGNVSAGNVLTSAEVIATGVVQSGTGLSTGGYLSVNGATDLHATTVTGNLSATGNVTGNYFIGNGSQLTGISVNTGNVTFSDQVVMGTGSTDGTGGLYLAPGNASIANSAVQYLRVRGGDVVTHIHLDTGNNQYYDQYFGDDGKYVKLANTGNVVIGSDDAVGNSAQWTFGTSGNLTLPRGGVVYETNIPDGGLNGNTIALAPSGGTNANQQLLIYPTTNDANHLHLTSGNLYSTELFLGDDNLFVKLANTGNVVINSNDGVGNTAQWTFGGDGNLTLPGNLVIAGNTSVFGTNASLLQPTDNLPLLALSSGANGAVSSLWVEDIGNVGTSNIAAVYANPTVGSGIVRIAVGQNGGGGPNLWDFGATGNLTAPGNISATGNITGGNITTAGLVSATGNITGGNLNITGNIVDTGALSLVTAASGNVNLAPNGTNTLVVTTTGANITGTLNATGNITANNLALAGNITSSIGFTGATITINNAPGGNEGAEVIWSLPSPANTVLSTSLVQDVYQNGMRFFESGGNSRGLYMDLGNVPNGSGTVVGYRDIPQVAFTANTTIATTDAGRHYYSTQSTSYILTIANNASQGLQVGAAISIVNQGTGNITVAQGSGVTLYLAGNATSGNRTVATFGMATLIKVATDTWFINGTGVA